MAELADESVDVVVTSPPYNVGIAYGEYQDRRNREEYLRWCLDWASEIHRVLNFDGSLFLNLGASSSAPLLPHELILRMASDLFRLQNTIHWVKSISVEDSQGNVSSHGHFKPVNSQRRLNQCHEYVFHLTKTDCVKLDRLAVGVPYSDKSNIRRWDHTDGRDVRCRGNVWFVPYRTIRDRKTQRPHPATFPVKLAERCLRLHGSEGKVVMDPFMGIGTAGQAAKLAGAARFIGYEVDAEYFSIAKSCLQPVK